MNSRRVAAAVLVIAAVLVALLLVWLPRAPGEDSKIPARPDAAANAPDSTEETNSENRPPSRPLRRPKGSGDPDAKAPTSDAPTVFTGWVETEGDDEDEDFPGATVTLVPCESLLGDLPEPEADKLPPGFIGVLGDPVASTMADREGAFEIAAPRPGRYALRASSRGYADTVEWAGRDVTLVLRKANTYELFVTDVRDRPIADARVVHHSYGPDTPPLAEHRTDDDGRTVLTAAHDDELVVSAEGYALLRIDSVGDLAGAPIILFEGLSVAGVVVDTSGAPIAGALVGCEDATLPLTRTDDDGRFRFEGFRAGWLGASLEVSADGFVANDSEWAVPGATDARVVLVRPGSIAGTTTDEDGRPLNGARMILMVPGRGRTVIPSAEDGTYRFEGLVPGDYRVAATRQEPRKGLPGLATTHSVERHVALGEGESIGGIDLTPIALPLSFVHVRLVDDDGKPVPSIHLHPGPDHAGGDAVATTGDCTCVFAFNREVGSEAQIRLWGAGFERWQVNDVTTTATVSDSPVDVVVETPHEESRIPVHLSLRREDGKPFPPDARAGWYIERNPPHGDGVQPIERQPLRGTSWVRGGAPYVIRAWGDGCATGVYTGTAPVEGTLQVDCVLAAGASVEGRVVTRGGKPYLHVRVAVTVELPGGHVATRTVVGEDLAADGSFTVDRLPRGPARLLVHEDKDSELLAERALTVPASGRVDLGDVVVHDFPIITGTVRDPGGERRGGVMVTVHGRAQSNPIVSSSTRADGTFELATPIRPGTTLRIADSTTASVVVLPIAESLTERPLSILLPPPTELRVRLADYEGSWQGISHEVRRAEDGLHVWPHQRTSLGEDGALVLDAMPVGRFVVRAWVHTAGDEARVWEGPVTTVAGRRVEVILPSTAPR